MKFIDLALQLLPPDIPCQEIPLLKGRLPVTAMFPTGNEYYNAGIVVPAVDVKDSIDIITDKLPDAQFLFKTLENILKQNGLIEKEANMTPYDYAVFSIYHELGHWLDLQQNYISMGLDGGDYMKDYKNEDEKLDMGSLTEQIRSVEAGSDIQNELLTLFYKKYRENKFEVTADNYAI